MLMLIDLANSRWSAC